MCACLSVLVIVCVFECVFECACSPSICVRENLYLLFWILFVCVRACNREDTSHTSSRVDGSDQGPGP